jgi:hypothetical protein
MAGGGKVDVAARLVGLGFQRELEVIPVVLHVAAQEVEALPEPLGGLDRILRRVHLGAFPAAPEHVDVGAQLHAQVHRAHRLLQGVRADLGVIRGEGAVLEDGVAEEVGGGHRDLHIVVREGLLELRHDPVSLRRRGVDGDQVVIVEVHAVGAERGEPFHALAGHDLLPDGLAKRVATGIPEGPETKGKPVGFSRLIGIHAETFRSGRPGVHVLVNG